MSGAGARAGRTGPCVYIGPEPHPLLVAAVEDGQGSVTAEVADTEMVVWRAYQPDELAPLLHPGIRWVQLAAAGVDRWLGSGMIEGSRTWMSGAGSRVDRRGPPSTSPTPSLCPRAIRFGDTPAP